MKKVKYILVFALFFLAAALIPSNIKAQNVSVSFQFFYDNLSPYGTWVNYPAHGYVWVPNVGPGFRPYYSDGRWLYTEYGWMWVSNYDWGWAPFHYGTWLNDPIYGWMWVPGYDWAPAWVSWGYYSGYYGWAPISPGYTYSYSPPINYWVFVNSGYMTSPSWRNHCHVSYNNRITLNNNTYITSTKNIKQVNTTGTYQGRKFSAGPSKSEFENQSKKSLVVYSVNEKSQPGKNTVSTKQVNAYRPKITESGKNTAKPQKTVNYDNTKKPVQQGNINKQDKVQPQKITPVSKEQGKNFKNTKPQVIDQPANQQQVPKTKPVKPQLQEEPKKMTPVQKYDKPQQAPVQEKVIQPKSPKVQPGQNQNYQKPQNKPVYKPQPMNDGPQPPKPQMQQQPKPQYQQPKPQPQQPVMQPRPQQQMQPKPQQMQQPRNFQQPSRQNKVIRN